MPTHFANLVYSFVCVLMFSRPIAAVELPTFSIQVGAARTATTLQFNAICGAYAVKIMFQNDTNATLECAMWGQKNWHIGLPREANHYLVLKTHGKLSSGNVQALQNISAGPLSGWVFDTKRGRTRHSTAVQLEKWFSRAVTVDYQDAVTSGYRAQQKKYQQLFEMSEEESDVFYDWLSKWDILRRCCGRQMSKSWRSYLQKPSKSASGSTVTFCKSINVSQVERDLYSTALVQHMLSRTPALARGRT